MARHILHVDMNAFYASVECQRRPELRKKPVAVCGDPEARHGIVLTANYVAKPKGVKTGMAIWQAKQVCPDLVVLPADMGEYIRISHMAREIYERYTDQIEPFGLDESWIDVTVDELRRRYGYMSVRRAITMADPLLGGINPKDDHTVHPVGYFGG